MDVNIMRQLKTMMEINRDQKERLNRLVSSHPEWDPILRHDIIHHCLLQDAIPEPFENESDFEFNTRVILFRRRIDEQNRLAGCLLMVLEGIPYDHLEDNYGGHGTEESQSPAR